MRQTSRTSAARTDNVEFRVPVLAHAQGDAPAVRREGRATVRSRKIDDATASAAGQIDRVNIRITTLVTGVGNATAVRADGRMHADDAVVRQLPHIRSVVIADVHFLLTAARGDERNLARRKTFIARERLHHVIREAMRVFAGTATVCFRQHRPSAAIHHLALQAAAASRTARRGPGIRTERKITGHRQVVLQSLGRRRAFTPCQRRHGQADLVAFANRDRRRLFRARGNGEDRKQGQ